MSRVRRSDSKERLHPEPTVVPREDLLRALVFERLLAQDPGNPLLMHQLSELLARIGRPLEACRRLAEAAVLYARQGSFSKAETLSRTVHSQCPDDPHSREILRAMASLTSG